MSGCSDEAISLSDLVRRRLRAVLQWTLDLIFSKDVTQYLTVHAPAVLRDEDERRLPLGTTRS